MPCTRQLPWLIVAGSILALTAGRGLAADVVLDEDFGGPETTWRVPTSGGVRVLDHQRRREGSDDGPPRTTERVVVACPAGYSANLHHPTARLPVVDELQMEVRLRCNRPGLQLAAQVVFPRNTDPETDQPVKTLVRGLRYSRPGQWQRLSLDKLPLLAERYARLLSADPRQQIDSREAYVDRVVLVVPGGEQETIVDIDRLSVEGVAPQTTPSADSDLEGPLLRAAGSGSDDHQAGQRCEPVEVRRRGRTLAVEGVRLLPRAVEYRGESFEWLAELGFNAVWMAETPTVAQLREAREARLWVVCPPPAIDELEAIERDSVWQTVLAWVVAQDCDARQRDAIAARTEQLRNRDPLERPLLIAPHGATRQFSSLADVLVERQTISLADAHAPQAAHATLPVMGCSPWASLSLGWSGEAVAQVSALAPRARHLGWHEPRRLHQQAIAAMASGARGLVIRTPQRLSGTSPEAERLTDQLRLLNSELALVEPWLVAGKPIAAAELTGGPIETTAWQLGQMRLVFVPPPSGTGDPPNTAALTMAGVPETATAHLLSPAGLLPVTTRRVPGGLQVPLRQLPAGGMVLLTGDSQALASAKQRIGKQARELANIERSLAMAEVVELESIDSQLFDARRGSDPSQHLAALKQGIQKCDQLLAARDYPRVMHLARQLRRGCNQHMQRLLAEQVPRQQFESVPTQFDLRLLPTHRALDQAIRGLPRGPNLLAGGDFENLQSTREAGWVHANHAEARLSTAVEFTSRSPKHGRACLRLAASSIGGAARPDDDSQMQPVVWIRSPEVPVPPSSILEISGWVRMTPREGDTGQLWIVDSLGGEELAVRLDRAEQWQPFRLVRAATDQRQLQLSLALTGAASAEIDAVMVREVLRPDRQADRRGAVPSGDGR